MKGAGKRIRGIVAVVLSAAVVAGMSGAVYGTEAYATQTEEQPQAVSEYTNTEKVEAFVKHCYETVLGREADAEGLQAYMGLILNGQRTPKQVAHDFIFSDEFQGKLPGNEAFIRILYKLYLYRDADAEGLAAWVAQLESGVGLEAVLGLDPVQVGQGQVALVGLLDAAHAAAGLAQQQGVGGEQGHLGVVGDERDVVGQIVAQDAVCPVALDDLVVAEKLHVEAQRVAGGAAQQTPADLR